MAHGTSDWKSWPRSQQRMLVAFFAACALLFALDGFDLFGRYAGIDSLEFKTHRHYPVEGWLGFYGVYGLVGCVLLVLAAKVLRLVVMRDEDYYGEDAPDDRPLRDGAPAGGPPARGLDASEADASEADEPSEGSRGAPPPPGGTA